MAWGRGVQPSQHAHTEMRWEPEGRVATTARCVGCGQQWRLQERQDKSGKLLWSWVVVQLGDSDPSVW